MKSEIFIVNYTIDDIENELNYTNEKKLSRGCLNLADYLVWKEVRVFPIILQK